MLYRAKHPNFYLLLLLIVFFICNAMLASRGMHGYLITASMTFTILICINMIKRNRFVTLATIPIALLVICSYGLVYAQEPTTLLYTLHFTLNGIFLVVVTIIEIRAVAAQQVITLNTLLGAVCGYLLIGLTWSYFFMAISHAYPGSFNPEPSNLTFRDNLDFFTYFSFSTLTTLGYGDVVPVSHLARTLAWMEAALGQVYLAVWISQLVAIHIAQRLRKI